MDKGTLVLLQNGAVIISSILVYFITKRPLAAYLKSRKAHREIDSAISLWEKGIEAMCAIRAEHYRLFHKMGIPRNAFFVAHNGGSAPSKETDFFTAVKDETGVCADGESLGPHMQQEYGTPIKVDFSYAVMIEEAYKRGHIHYKDINDMPDSLLKRIYLQEKVKEVVIVFYSLNLQGFRFGYASHGRYEEGPPFTEDQVNSIILSGNRLRTKFGTKLLGGSESATST